MSQLGARNVKTAHNFSVYTLLDWPPGKSDTLSHLVMSLKTADAKAWAFFAEQFYLKWKDHIPNPHKIVFISHESISVNRHSQNWAQTLSHIFGGSVVEALAIVKETKAQKKLSRSLREGRRMSPLVEISSLADQNLVFVDDVVTTGFTALAAYKALGCPKNYQVWSLAWRPASSIAVS